MFEQLPTTTRPERTGDNAVERLATGIVRREIAAMPASLVVQLALWPDDVAHWAREAHLSESLVYNMLAARKPYSRTRARLADRLGTSIAVIDHLVEARRPQPTVRLGPDALAPAHPGHEVDRLPSRADELPPIDWHVPPFPRYRDGTNPIERRAVRTVEVDIASMPAATAVGLAIWPETLAEWSRHERLKSSVVWATLAGSPSGPVRDALARRLGVSLRDLDALVSLARRVPTARRSRGGLETGIRELAAGGPGTMAQRDPPAGADGRSADPPPPPGERRTPLGGDGGHGNHPDGGPQLDLAL